MYIMAVILPEIIILTRHLLRNILLILKIRKKLLINYLLIEKIEFLSY